MTDPTPRSDKELEQAYANLTAVQERCTQLLLERRAASAFALGRDGDDDQRPWVSVARNYGTPWKWTVYVVTWHDGLVGPTERRFETQAAALEYGLETLALMRAEK